MDLNQNPDIILLCRLWQDDSKINKEAQGQKQDNFERKLEL